MQQPTFTEKFDNTVYAGETLTATVDGFKLVARIEHDSDAGTPWDREDGHGPVSKWTRRDKRPGERVLKEDRRSKRYYDYAEAIQIAKRDGWDAAPFGEGTPGQRAERAVNADFKRLRDWCNGEWTYVGVVLAVSRNGVELSDHAASLWGIESDCGDYLTDMANELAGEALATARDILRTLCACDEDQDEEAAE